VRHQPAALVLTPRQQNLAMLYYVMGRFSEAEPLCWRALAIRHKVLPEGHPNTAKNLNTLALCCIATGREREALELMERAVVVDDHMIGQVFSIGSEVQRMAYLATLRANFDAFLSLVARYFPHDRDAVAPALDLVLRRKAIGAEALAAQRDAVLGGQYPALVPRLKDLSLLRRQIAQKTLAGPG
jgi:hypothetical protein